MKGKRILTMLLSVLMVLQLLPSIALAAVVSESAAYSVVTELPAGRPGAPENSILAINNFNVAGGKISFELDIVATLSTGAGSDGSTIDAVVMSAADYTGSNHGNSPIKINNTNFNSSTLLQVSATYWRSGTATVTSGKASFASLGANLPLRSMKTDNISGNMITDNDCYYDDYVLILFNAGVGAAAEGRYVVKKFQVDSQGNLKADSYMVRYVKNTASIGTTAAVGGTVDPQITKPSTATTTLSPKVYTRTGYTFMGWDDDAKFLEKQGTGTGSELANAVGDKDDTALKVGMGYPVGGTNTTVPAQEQDAIYNLYAQWKPNAVKFDTGKADAVTASGGTAVLSYMKDPIPVLTLPSPQVNEAYKQDKIALAASPTDKNTNKTYGTYSGKTLTLSTGETVTTSNPGTYGLTFAADGKTAWKVTGTPQADSKGNDVYILLQVQDDVNKTQDWIVIHFEEVKKGAQPIPTQDANTGLQSRVVTSAGDDGGEVKDGQIYGFYSGGPKKGADTGYLNGTNATNGTNGTGTMTEYYWNLGMVYEYRPVQVGGVPVTYESDDAGWREVPFPESWYTEAQKTTLLASMEKNAATYVKSTKKSYNTTTKVGSANTEAPVAVPAWPDSYGSVAFEGGLPIIRGLTENDQYEVRFRANETFEVSKAQKITVGGAVAGGEASGGSGLAVNLAGGAWKDADKAAAEAFVNAAAALQPGGTLTLPEIEPERDGGSKFLGWTLGERDSDGRLILYRHGTAVTPPETPETVTVKWVNGATGAEISHTVTSVPKGSTVAEEDYPEAPADVDKEAEGEQPAVHKTFDKWAVAVDETTGNITITATFKDKPAVTYVWADPLKEGDDKTVGTSFTGYNSPAKEQYPADPVHEGEALFKEWVMGEPVEVPVEGGAEGETKLQVTITATYKEKATYIWVDPLKEGEDKTVQTVADAYDVPAHPEMPSHGEDHPFKEWAEGEPETVDGVTTITFTAVYKEKVTYIWVDPEIKGEEGQEPPSQVVQTKETFDELTEADHPETNPSHPGMDFKGWKVGEPVKGEDGTVTVTITAVYGKLTTYLWVDPKKDGDDKTVKGPEAAFEKPEDPAAPVHEGWIFTGWTVGEPVTDEETGVTSVTITASYDMEKWTYRDTLPAIEKFPASLAAVWDGGSGAGGLALNLAGGRVPEAQQEAFDAFVQECHALTPGGTVEIPNITPVKQYYEFAGWTLGNFKEDGTLETFQAGDKVTLGNEPSALTAVWNATTEAFFPIVFYDWDGVTLLGTKIVPIVADVPTQERLIDDAMREFAELQMSVPNAEAYRAAGYDPAQGTDEAFYNAEKPLSNKKGYTFGKWIDFDAKDENGNEVYTNYGAVVNVTNNTRMAADIPEPAGHLFSEKDYSEGITVKAAFRSNATLEPLRDAGTDARHYTVTVTDYLQYGSGTNYGLTVKINRAQGSQGVPRVRKLGLRVELIINNDTRNPVFLLQELDNKDEISSIVAVNGTVTSASFTVIDLCDNLLYGGTTNWASSASPRSLAYSVTPGGEKGFVIMSGVGFFNDLCKSSTALGLVSTDWSGNSQAFRDSGLSVAAGNYTTAGLTGASGAAGRRNGVAKILAMYQSLPETRNLTKKEMQEAITNNTIWDSANSCWSNPGFVSDFVDNQ